MSRVKKGKYKRRRNSIFLVVLLIGIILGTLVVHGVNLQAEVQKLSVQEQELKEKKENLKNETKSIKEEAEYMKSDKYIEDVAREKFGLVYDNEIVFKAADSK